MWREDRPGQPRFGRRWRGRHWALVASLIQTAKLNDVDPFVWLTDMLERIVSGRTKRNELHRLLPWNWAAPNPGVVSS